MGDNWSVEIMEYTLPTAIPFTFYSYVKFASSIFILFLSYIIANKDLCFPIKYMNEGINTSNSCF